VKRAFWGGAVAGRLAAAGLQFIDGAFEELAKRQQVFEALLIVSQERPDGLAQATGALGGSGQGQSSLYVVYHNNIKKSICFNKKNEGRTKLSLAEWRQAVWRLDGGDRAKLAGPVVSGFQQHLPDGRPCGLPDGEFTV
jgi:hypothetical protein